MKLTPLLYLLLFAACRSLPAGGRQATPQRPTLSSDTSTTAAGTFELEAGAALFDGGSLATPTSLKYGLSDSGEVFLGWSPYVQVDFDGSKEDGVGDLSVGTRHRLIEEGDSTPSFAVQTVLKLPTADEERGLGSGELDFLLAAIANKSVESWNLTAFGELDFLGDPRGGVLLGQSVALAASHPLAEHLGFFGEVAGVFVPEIDSEIVFSTLGLAYSPHPFQVLDVGCIVGLSDEAPDFGIVVGLTRNLGRARVLGSP